MCCTKWLRYLRLNGAELLSRFWGPRWLLATDPKLHAGQEARMTDKVDDKLWKNWLDTMGVPGEIKTAERNANGISFEFIDDESGTSWNLPLRSQRKYTVGVDLVGFSQRSTEGQLLLTAVLFSRLDSTLRLLRQVGWVGSDPSAVIPTGDGALLVFDSFNGAFATILTLHMFLSDVTLGRWCRVAPAVEPEGQMRALPFEVRYALASGELVPIKDVNRQKNYVGEGLVRVARVLAASKGAHFLVDERVMAECLARGGINATADEECDWSQQFHVSRMSERKVKASCYTFYNVFGFFRPTGLMRRKADVDIPDVERRQWAYGFADTAQEYEIGSHDVSAIPPS